MGLLQMAALGAAGYAAYHVIKRNRGHSGHAAFASGETDGTGNFAKVRTAGPEGMRSKAAGQWDKTDEASDESFPASDPPATY